ncbi:pentapeptide repeat-containing protein [Nostoc ellipsosporum NOK]|nr:pentapeptide repeat-containing protein [Nostoc ellipsosporum NOK]
MLIKAYLGNADLSHSTLNKVDFSDADLVAADIFDTKFCKAKNLTSEVVKKAINWEKACYDVDFCKQLGLPNTNTTS